MMEIKVCGMRDPQTLTSIARSEPDRLGFIFHPGSPRNALDLEPERVKDLPRSIVRTGVFVTDQVDTILRTAENYALDSIQLHGVGEVEHAHRLRKEGYEVLRAIRVASEEDLEKVQAFQEAVDLFLFDTKTEGFRGGSGRKFDHALLEKLPRELPFFLAGGIGPEDGKDPEPLFRTGATGVDINSRFETEAGRKDPGSIDRFIKDIKGYEPVRSGS